MMTDGLRKVKSRKRADGQIPGSRESVKSLRYPPPPPLTASVGGGVGALRAVGGAALISESVVSYTNTADDRESSRVCTSS